MCALFAIARVLVSENRGGMGRGGGIATGAIRCAFVSVVDTAAVRTNWALRVEHTYEPQALTIFPVLSMLAEGQRVPKVSDLTTSLKKNS